MEMKVDAKLIRAEREKRGWSQEHLANVADLGLRTIQRIEANGLASYESVSAIASVLGLSIAKLRSEDDENKSSSIALPHNAPVVERSKTSRSRELLPGIALAIGIIVSSLVAKRVPTYWWLAPLVLAFSIGATGALSKRLGLAGNSVVAAAVIFAFATLVGAAVLFQTNPPAGPMLIPLFGAMASVVFITKRPASCLGFRKKTNR
jgi:transcriptional regulator with XRE-family HTH domain